MLIVSSVNAVNNWQKDKQFRILEREKENDKTFVIREGQVCSVKTFDLMVGDIVQLQQGDRITSDGVMISGKGNTYLMVLILCVEVKVDQAALTGEAVAVSKNLTSDPFMLSGGIMSDGDARMVVLAVGAHSGWGKIQQSLDAEESETPLQEDLEKLAKHIHTKTICVINSLQG